MVCGWKLAIVKRTKTGFNALPRCWVVERTFAWVKRNRRLSKDYEQHPQNREAIENIAVARAVS